VKERVLGVKKKGPKGINYFVNNFINGHLILEILITYDIS
jgi:hypothetical protein